MKALFDTSVLTAAMVSGHRAHSRCRPWLARARSGELEGFVAAHVLAELYAALTSLPLQPPIAASTARRMVRDNVESAIQVVALSRRNYSRVLDDMAAGDLRGPSIYDALCVRAAKEAQVDRLLTLEVAHFRRLWPDAGDVIQEP